MIDFIGVAGFVIITSVLEVDEIRTIVIKNIMVFFISLVLGIGVGFLFPFLNHLIHFLLEIEVYHKG